MKKTEAFLICNSQRCKQPNCLSTDKYIKEGDYRCWNMVKLQKSVIQKKSSLKM